MTTKAWIALKERLLSQLDLITPNMEEARLLVGAGINERIPSLDLAKKCLGLGAHAVLLKAGHDDDPKVCTDILAQQKEGPELLKYPRIDGGTEVRGTGCRLASAIACHWAKTGELLSAVQGAGQYLQNYIKESLS